VIISSLPSLTQPFENDNAKYLNPEEIARTFVPLEVYWTLFSEKNHVVLGTRGSGKTAIGRMLSHDHLRFLDHPAARQIVSEKRFIGCYAPARLNWVTGLRSQTLTAGGQERAYFNLRFNFVVSQAFLKALGSLLYTVGPKERAEIEYNLVNRILNIWCPAQVPESKIFTLRDLAARLSEVDFRLQRLTSSALYGATQSAIPFDQEIAASFGTEICAPVFVLRDAAMEAFGLPSAAKFIITIDEMEFLNKEHHRILNGLLRADTPGFVFKFITAPYCHYTLDTETNAPLIEGNDFEYVHMDHKRNVDRNIPDIDLTGIDRRHHFPVALFLKRARASGLDLRKDSLAALLGPSEVLDPISFKAESTTDFARRFIRHANDSTQARILKQLNTSRRPRRAEAKTDGRTQLSNELFRKMKPAVIMRELVRDAFGAKKGTAFSGMAMVLACTDSNPRLLIRTFKMMFPDLEAVLRRNDVPVQASRQNEVLETISQRFWDTIYAVPDYGPKLADMISRIGEYFERRLHTDPIGTDIPGSILIDPDDKEFNQLIHQAVAWGFMYPHFKDEHRAALPGVGGEFRLAYTLAPRFKILPRRGRVVPLGAVFPQRNLFG